MVAGALSALVLAPAAFAAPEPGAYGENDFGGFRNVNPPGQGQTVNAVDIAAFLATGQRPPHDQDQLEMYEELVRESPGLGLAQLRNHFKDATFGARLSDRERTYSPRGDVTIVRDEFGVPHIYGSGRAGAMFGAGYVAAEDRLFFIDALRHSGRAELSTLAGGAAGNRQMDQEVWADTPYLSDAELQLQYDRADELYGEDGRQIQQDVQSYVAGINQYIAEARVNPLKMPGEYTLLGHLTGPDDWKVTDVISVASLVAGIFGKGGGNELGSALALEEARKRFGRKQAMRVWRDFRRAEDPEAPVTARGKRFRYRKPPRKVRGRALPDSGTTRHHDVVVSSAGGGEAQAAAEASDLPDIGDLLGATRELEGSSNALLVSARRSQTGRALAVMGPQVSYYSPQILMEMGIHAPGGPSGPPVSARGVAFPGTNLYVQMGHGPDYAWSATSAGQDITDTFAVRLCEPDGSAPTLQSMHYVFRGACEPIEVLEKTNSWQMSLGDSTPSGSETLRAERTKLGIVIARARIDARPHAYTRLRATYFHEVDSAIGFADINNPDLVRSPQSFMRAAAKIDYTFNWFYADHDDIAFFNSGANQRRARNTHPDFPVHGRPELEWPGFEPPPALTHRGEPFRKHPRVVNQSWITNWNNKQARGYRASDDQWGFGPTYRSVTLDERIRRHMRGGGRINLPQLVDAMEDAATVDLRGDRVLPWVLRVVRPAKVRNPELRDALRTLRAWERSGAHRRDSDADGTYDDTDAIRIMDAWWPRLVAAQFRPRLGADLFAAIRDMVGLHNAPGPGGSSFAGGWYGYVQKDLRALLGKPVSGEFSRGYCGNGRLGKCRQRLRSSLADALASMSDADIYPGQPDGACAGHGDAQWCTDAIRHSATGAVTQPPIHWVNRPTFQQVVEVQGER